MIQGILRAILFKLLTTSFRSNVEKSRSLFTSVIFLEIFILSFLLSFSLNIGSDTHSKFKIIHAFFFLILQHGYNNLNIRNHQRSYKIVEIFYHTIMNILFLKTKRIAGWCLCCLMIESIVISNRLFLYTTEISPAYMYQALDQHSVSQLN